MCRMSEERAAVGAGTKEGKPGEVVVDPTRGTIGVTDALFVELGDGAHSGPVLSSAPPFDRGGVLALSGPLAAPPPLPLLRGKRSRHDSGSSAWEAARIDSR